MAFYSFKHMAVTLGRKIQHFRNKRGLTQENLAEELGISRTYVSYIEAGTQTPSLKVLYKIAKFLHVEIKVFFLNL